MTRRLPQVVKWYSSAEMKEPSELPSGGLGPMAPCHRVTGMREEDSPFLTSRFVYHPSYFYFFVLFFCTNSSHVPSFCALGCRCRKLHLWSSGCRFQHTWCPQDCLPRSRTMWVMELNTRSYKITFLEYCCQLHSNHVLVLSRCSPGSI